MEEHFRARAADPCCTVIAANVIDGERGPFKSADRGHFVRIARLDPSQSALVLQALRPRDLHPAHYPRFVGYSGSIRIYQFVKREFYRPCRALDGVCSVRFRTPCAKKRVRFRRPSEYLKLFSELRLLDFVAINILGPFRKTKDCH